MIEEQDILSDPKHVAKIMSVIKDSDTKRIIAENTKETDSNVKKWLIIKKVIENYKVKNPKLRCLWLEEIMFTYLYP